MPAARTPWNHRGTSGPVLSANQSTDKRARHAGHVMLGFQGVSQEARDLPSTWKAAPYQPIIVTSKLALNNTSWTTWGYLYVDFFLSWFFIFYLFLERGKRRKKERERNIHAWEKHLLVASRMPLPGDLAHNPGMCPDQEPNRWPLVCWTTPNSPSYTSQGICGFF